jgi:SAM-dependent methyltransferase
MKFRKFPDPHPANVLIVEEAINESDVVLDLGGWWKPFARANYVVDYLPFHTRAQGGRIGRGSERFSHSTWIQQDICAKQLPFKDKEIDFVYCGQTLEDVRDPLYVCKEIIRVGKRGYIEVPSPWIECQFNVDEGELAAHYPGYEKHRWIVMIEGQKITFVPKQIWLSLYEFVPQDEVNQWRVDQRIWTTYLLWQGAFQYEELIFAGRDTILPLLRRYFRDFDYTPFINLAEPD